MDINEAFLIESVNLWCSATRFGGAFAAPRTTCVHKKPGFEYEIKSKTIGKNSMDEQFPLAKKAQYQIIFLSRNSRLSDSAVGYRQIIHCNEMLQNMMPESLLT